VIRDANVIVIAGIAVNDVQRRRVVARSPFRQFVRLCGHVGRELAGSGDPDSKVVTECAKSVPAPRNALAAVVSARFVVRTPGRITIG
jgi:hypothetical protein